MTTEPQKLAAISRADRLIAANRARDYRGISAVIDEAAAEHDGMRLLVLATSQSASDLADRYYGDAAQVELDGRAMDAMFYEQRELRRLADDA